MQGLPGNAFEVINRVIFDKNTGGWYQQLEMSGKFVLDDRLKTSGQKPGRHMLN